MGYQIHEMAKLLNLSKQMIRYYEQCGVIKPERLENNNYRIYNTLDYFALTEAISLSRFNVNIKDIYDLKANDYTKALSHCYHQYIEDTTQELQYKHLLMKRTEELLERIDSAEMNIGNLWIKRIPKHRLYPLTKSKDDHYGNVDTPVEVRTILNSSDILPFGDGYLEINEECDRWWLSFKKNYVDGLNLPECQGMKDIEEAYCICCIVNMGEIGEFKTDMIKEKIVEIMKLNYKFIGKPQCLLLCRGIDNNQFRRLLEIQIPILKP